MTAAVIFVFSAEEECMIPQKHQAFLSLFKARHGNEQYTIPSHYPNSQKTGYGYLSGHRVGVQFQKETTANRKMCGLVYSLDKPCMREG